MNDASINDGGPEPAPSASGDKSLLQRPGAFVFGVILPLAALWVEMFEGMCADIYFDPLPTLLHIPLVASVPAYWVLVHRNDGLGRFPRLCAFLCGLAAAVSAAYALAFAPLLPVALLGILYFGLGLLPFAPVFAFLWLFRPAKGFVKAGGSRRAAFGLGALTASGVLALPLVSGVFTVYQFQRAVSDSPESRLSAARSLRRFDSLLGCGAAVQRAALVGAAPRLLGNYTSLNAGWIGLPNRDLSPGEMDRAAEAYFRAFGRAPDPGEAFSQRPGFDMSPRMQDGIVQDLWLDDSAVAVQLDRERGFAYAEWTLSFRTTSVRQQEVRLLLDLPPGGVVSRATLWVAWEPREATFAATGLATAAYESVVRKALDPLLVTQPAPGRALVRGFPVTNASPFKFRIGVTLPLLCQEDGRFLGPLPRVVERNFRLPRPAITSVEAFGDAPFSLGPRAALEVEPAAWEAQESVEFLQRGNLELTGALGPERALSNLYRNDLNVPEAVVLVLETDGALGERRAEVVAALGAWPANVDLGIVLAGDTPVVALAMGSMADPDHRARAIEAVSQAQFAGGVGAGEALIAGAAAAEESGATLLWLVGPQPVTLEGDDNVPKRLGDHRPAGLALFRLTDETNRLADTLLTGLGRGKAPFPKTVELPPAGPLDRVIAGWTAPRSAGQGWPRSLARTLSTETDPEDLDAGSMQLFRLSAASRISELVQAGGASLHEALALGVRAGIVTRVTGAVILESDAMTEEAGLELSSGEVPVVPEPELLALLVLALMGAASFAFLRRGHAPRAAP